MKMNYKRTLLGRDIHTNKHTHQLFQEKGMTKKEKEMITNLRNQEA